jgi:hypothetical protein
MYKLCCLDPNIPDEYVGSTTNFKNRKATHKRNCKNSNRIEYNYKVYQFIRANGNWFNWTMVQIEPYPCNSNREAEAREEYWRKELKSTLNMIKAFTTKEERLDKQKEYQKEYIKEYYEKKIDVIKEQKKEWYENNKDEILDYHKKYREKNKDAINAKQRENLEKNRDTINTKRRERYRLKKEQEQFN